MNTEEIVIKAADGQPLSDEERQHLRDWTKEAQPHRLLELESKNTELNAGLEGLRQQLATAENEKSAAATQLAELRFRGEIAQLAAQYNFTDPDYLEFKFRRANLEVSDRDRATSFMEELKQSNPKLFKVALPSGTGGTGAVLSARPAGRPAGALEALIAVAPAIR